MSRLEKNIVEHLLPIVEDLIAKAILERHWPAIEETLRQEFGEAEIEVALKAGRRACERLVEHML